MEILLFSQIHTDGKRFSATTHLIANGSNTEVDVNIADTREEIELRANTAMAIAAKTAKLMGGKVRVMPAGGNAFEVA